MLPVTLQQVNKRYQLDSVAVPALADINLVIQPQRFTVLSGPSGSGKTTLRASLKRTRQSSCSLAQELDLVGALLAINQIRLGERLSYLIRVPAALRGAQLPPLLLQPLVENALQHGIEPAIAGGVIEIEAEKIGMQLCLRVVDTGMGLNLNAPSQSGIGLANVRDRLMYLYGSQATLSIAGNTPSGVVAELRIPFAE